MCLPVVDSRVCVFSSILTEYTSAHLFNLFTKVYALQLSPLQEYNLLFKKLLLLCNSHTRAFQDMVAVCDPLGVPHTKALLQGGGLNVVVHLVSHWPAASLFGPASKRLKQSPHSPALAPSSTCRSCNHWSGGLLR